MAGWEEVSVATGASTVTEKSFRPLGSGDRSNHLQPLKHDLRSVCQLSPSVVGEVMSFIRWRQMYKDPCPAWDDGLHEKSILDVRVISSRTGSRVNYPSCY